MKTEQTTRIKFINKKKRKFARDDLLTQWLATQLRFRD